MGRFKRIYLAESVKESKQKALGLEHLAFNNYKDKNGDIWHWVPEKNDFEKPSIETIIDKLIQEKIKYVKDRQDRDIKFTKISDYLYKDSDEKYYHYNKKFNSLMGIVKSKSYATEKPDYIKQSDWNKVIKNLDEQNKAKEEKEKKDLEYWESKQGDLTNISNRINYDSKFKESIDKLDFLTVPKDYLNVNVEEVDEMSPSKNVDKMNVGGRYYIDDVAVEVKKGSDKSILYHELGHWLDYGGYEKTNSNYYSDHEFSKLIKKVNSMPTIKKLQDINSNGYYEINEEKVILDERMSDYVKYLLKPNEIFARLFAQYICTKFDYPIDYIDLIPNQWSYEEFSEIKVYMDSMFKRMGWMK